MGCNPAEEEEEDSTDLVSAADTRRGERGGRREKGDTRMSEEEGAEGGDLFPHVCGVAKTWGTPPQPPPSPFLPLPTPRL